MRIRAVRISGELPTLVRDASSLEEGARRVVSKLYDELVVRSVDQRCAVLVRIFVMAPYDSLPANLQQIAMTHTRSGELLPRTPCLTLLATRGDLPEWNDRRSSRNHQCIPLVSEDMLRQSPMISQLMNQFGVKAAGLFEPQTGALLARASEVYDLFHVEEATGSPHIPAQDEFVKPHRIRSVVGFGGPLVRGWIYAGIVFSKSTISREAATAFSTIALATKLAFAGLSHTPAFDPAA